MRQSKDAVMFSYLSSHHHLDKHCIVNSQSLPRRQGLAGLIEQTLCLCYICTHMMLPSPPAGNLCAPGTRPLCAIISSIDRTPVPGWFAILDSLNSLVDPRDVLLNFMTHRTLRILTLVPRPYSHLHIKLGLDLSL